MQEIQMNYNGNNDLNGFIDAINASNNKRELTENLNEICAYLEEKDIGVQETLDECGFNYSYQYINNLGIEAADGDEEWYRVIECTIQIWATDSEEDFAICVEGDQVFREETATGARYTHGVDHYETDWPNSFETELESWIDTNKDREWIPTPEE
jgi:hypothetical protein